MSVHEETFSTLKDMGIDPTLAREAASRYHSVDAAINWCFGDGANWQPDPSPAQVLPGYSDTWSLNDTTVEHREVANDESMNDIASSSQFGLSSTHPPFIPLRSQRNNTPSTGIVPIDAAGDDDENDELRKAIALSKVDVGAAGGTTGAVAGAGGSEDDRRQERERSVRAAGAPPPSPDPDSALEEGQVLGTLFGPSNKTDEEGKLALVPASQNNNNSSSTLSKEEEDMNRAIQESLMTASFHSASALRDSEKPNPVIRAEGAPLVFHSQSNQSTYAANLVQAMYAVPQLREAVLSALSTQAYMSQKGRLLGEMFQLPSSEPMSFVEVDDALNQLRDGWDRLQLPPAEPIMSLSNILNREFVSLLLSAADSSAATEADQRKRKTDAERMFNTSIEGDNPMESTFVTFRRQAKTSNDIYTHLSNILWPTDAPQSTIAAFSDVLTVFISWDAAAVRELWKLDETIVLDRFLKSNAAYAAHRRAQQSLSAGNARRLQERLDHLKFHQGNDYQESLKTPPDPGAMHAEGRKEMRAKLGVILEALQSKLAGLKSELDEVNKAASGSVFETDEPALRQHVYTLRAILMYDGAVVGQNHLFMYVRGDDGRWWKIQDHEISRVEWDTIANDKTGLWMDGGPYTLIYSREGERPTEPVAEEEMSPSVDEGVLVDISEDDQNPDLTITEDGGAVSGISKDVDELMS